MKKLTVTLLLMLALTSGMAAPTKEELSMLEIILNKHSVNSDPTVQEIIGKPVTSSEEKLNLESKVDTKEIPRFRHRNDGIALFAKNDVATVNQVMTSNPLYALIALLNSEVPDLVQAAEYVTLLDALTKINQTLNALLAEAKAGNERMAAIHEALTQQA